MSQVWRFAAPRCGPSADDHWASTKYLETIAGRALESRPVSVEGSSWGEAVVAQKVLLPSERSRDHSHRGRMQPEQCIRCGVTNI
jgi:hypothetical protein